MIRKNYQDSIILILCEKKFQSKLPEQKYQYLSDMLFRMILILESLTLSECISFKTHIPTISWHNKISQPFDRAKF